MSSSSFTKEALRRAADSPCPQLYQFSARSDFNKLWSWIDGRSVPDGDAFIIWDGLPDLEKVSALGLENHLTAFDWLVGLGLWAASRNHTDQTKVPRLRVHVLNLASRARFPNAFGPKHASILMQLAPWVRLYPFNARGLETFVRALRNTERTDSNPDLLETVQAAGHRDNLMLLKNLWVSNLTRADLRHSLANAIGPLLLARELSNAGYLDPAESSAAFIDDPTDPRRPFLSLLELLGLLSSTPSAENHEAPGRLGGLGKEPFVEADLFGRFQKLRFALVDDQCLAGFHEVLAGLLLRSSFAGPAQDSELAPDAHAIDTSGSSLSSFASPDFLLAWLKHASSGRTKVNWFVPRLFGKVARHRGAQPPPTTPLTEFDILFLDLRLFGIASGSDNKEAERQWLSRLVAFAETIQDAVHHDGGGARPSQAYAFRKVLESARCHLADEQPQVRHLALLPILIALCDPTTPIILFSSTQHRSVTEAFRPFPNIITAFAKPVFTGYQGEDSTAVRQSSSSLREALREALLIHERRLVWELFSNWSRAQFTAPPCLLKTREDRRETREDRRASRRRPRKQPKPTIHNVDQSSLPMRVSKQQFRYITETLRKFCAEREFLDLIPYPAAFTEAALLSAHRGVASDKEVVFDLGDIESTLRRVPAAQLRAARAVRRARNRAAHGHLIETASDLPALSWAAEALLVTFVLSVAPKRLVSHVLDTLVDDSPLLTSILQQKPTLPLDSLSANSHHTAVVEASTALWPHLGPKSSRLDRPDAFFATRNVGDLMDGTVVDVTADGASVSLDNCVEALLRADDIDWQPVDDARNHLTIGQVISVQITALNGDDGVVEVSMKGAIPHPLFSKLAIGGTVTARILDMGAFGCRVDLDHGVVVTLLASTDDTADLAIGGRVELVVRAMDRTSGKLDLAFPRSGAAAKLRNLK